MWIGELFFLPRWRGLSLSEETTCTTSRSTTDSRRDTKTLPLTALPLSPVLRRATSLLLASANLFPRPFASTLLRLMPRRKVARARRLSPSIEQVEVALAQVLVWLSKSSRAHWLQATTNSWARKTSQVESLSHLALLKQELYCYSTWCLLQQLISLFHNI